MSLRPETDYVYDSAAMIAEPDLVLGEIRKDGDLVWSNTMRRWLALSNAAARDTLRNRHLRVHDLFGNFKHIERYRTCCVSARGFRSCMTARSTHRCALSLQGYWLT
jgi:hypothetical protein